MKNDYRTLTTNTILHETNLIQATFKGVQKGQVMPWRQVTIRPVLIKGTRHLQFSYLDEQQDISKNYQGDDVEQPLQQLLNLPFKQIQLETVEGITHVQLTKKGKGIIHQHKHNAPAKLPTLTHDRAKDYLLPEHEITPFLQEIGIMTQDGKIRAAMRPKFRQINAFLQVIQHTKGMAEFSQSPRHIVDFGCGSAHLSFALYYYFNFIQKEPATLTGLDLKATLMEKHTATSQRLGWGKITFQTGSILDHQPENPPHLVLALHACDTATDEALYQAILAGSQFIFAAPCCHKHLNKQLSQQAPPVPFGPLFQDGILQSRQGDLLTDTFRATILRIMGYQTDVIEFISTEHTAKNVMLRATKRAKVGSPPRQLIQDYQAMKTFWQVTPYLETLLGDIFTNQLKSEL